MEQSIPNRRWILIAVIATIGSILAACIWLECELQFVYARHEARRRLAKQNGIAKVTAIHASVPLWRSWMGDEPIEFFVVDSTETSEAEIVELTRFFPEAKLEYWDR